MTRLRTIIACILIIAGASALAGPTFGFSTFAADRGTHVGTAADQTNAYLGLTAFQESIDDRQDTANAVSISNNLQDTLEVTAEVEIDTNDVRIADSNWVDGRFSGEITDVETITLECSGGGASGTARLSLEVLRATDGTVSVSNATETASVSYRCTGGGPPTDPGGFQSVAANDVIVTSDGTTQQLTFTPDGPVGNDEAVEITIGSVNIDYSEASIRSVGGINGNPDVTFDGDSNGGTITVPARGQLNDEVTVTLEGMEPNGGFLVFGLAEFRRTDSGVTEMSFFGVTDNSGSGNAMRIRSARTVSTDDGTMTVDRSTLEEVPLDDFDTIDSVDDLEDVAAESDEITFVENP